MKLASVRKTKQGVQCFRPHPLGNPFHCNQTPIAVAAFWDYAKLVVNGGMEPYQAVDTVFPKYESKVKVVGSFVIPSRKRFMDAWNSLLNDDTLLCFCIKTERYFNGIVYMECHTEVIAAMKEEEWYEGNKS